MATRVLDELRRRVETHGLAVEQGAAECRRVVVLEPGRHIGKQGKAGGVGFGKAVIAEALDLFEELLGEISLVAALQHAPDQLLAVGFQTALALPGRHGAA